MNSADKALAIIRRAGKKEAERKRLSRRMYGVYRMMQKRAAKLGKQGEIDFDVEQLRADACYMLGVMCVYCAARLTSKNMGVDHSIPIARGGTFSRINLSFPCKSCNVKKGNLFRAEFEALLSFLDNFDTPARGDVLRRLGLGAQFRSWKSTEENKNNAG